MNNTRAEKDRSSAAVGKRKVDGAAVAAVTAPVITIDGPSGSGKGTISSTVADRLGFLFLDSGALYRVVALASLNRKVPEDDTQALVDIAKTCLLYTSPSPRDRG